jgi:predicted metal-dependent enzyme (double-stranded beta helix superfamily)
MTYTLDAFVKDARQALSANNDSGGREQVRQLLEKLLANKTFVDEAVGPAAPMGTRKLYEDKDLGFVVLAHCNAKGHRSPPHDHGSSWAVYGQAIKYTDMSEYRRTDGGSDAGDAKLEKVKTYRLEPGHAGVYDVGAVHAIDYPEGSRFVRVTGRDLDYVRRLKYDEAAGKAITIESASASG